MKKILTILGSMLLASSVFATNASVMVNTTSGVIAYPTNFWTANGISLTGTVGALDIRVDALETNLLSYSNGLNAKIEAATNRTGSLSNDFYIVYTNYTTLSNGVLGTSAWYRVGILETNFVWTNKNLSTTGTVTALSFIGDGSQLTNVTSTVTGGVNQITVPATNATGTTNLTGNIVITGSGVTNLVGNTVTVYNIEYITRNIVIASNIYEYTVLGPYDEDITIESIFSKADAYTVNWTLITTPTNSSWRGDITDVIAQIANSNGTWLISNITVTAGNEWGVRVDDYDSRATQMRVRFKVKY